LKLAVAKARELGLKELWLWTDEDIANLYRKFGWEVQERAIHPDGVHPIVIMKASLEDHPLAG